MATHRLPSRDVLAAHLAAGWSNQQIADHYRVTRAAVDSARVRWGMAGRRWHRDALPERAAPTSDAAAPRARAGSVAIYARQSEDRAGDGAAVERQVAACRALAHQLGLPDEVSVYIDNDLSASTGIDRPAYTALLDALRAGLHDTLLVWHNDRLHRRPIELEEFIRVADARRIQIKTVQAGEIDMSTPTGRMVARIVGAMARQEVEHKGARRQAANLQRAMAGRHYSSTRGFGYGRTEWIEGRPHYLDRDTVNHREARAIRAAYRALLAGRTSRSIWRSWNTRGLLTPKGNYWDGTTFRNSLKRPALAGLVVYQGQVLDGVPARWPAIVTHEQWEAITALFADPRRHTAMTRCKSLCTGIALCPCGAPLRAGVNLFQHRKRRVRFPIYKCLQPGTGHVSILRSNLDAAVRAAAIAALADFQTTTARMPERTELIALLTNLYRDLGQANDKEHRLATAIADGTITRDGARRTARQIHTARTATLQAISDAQLLGRPDRPNQTRPRSDTRGFDDLPIETQRTLIRSLLQIEVRRYQPGVDRICIRPRGK